MKTNQSQFKMRKGLLLLSLLFIVFACSKDEDGQSDDDVSMEEEGIRDVIANLSYDPGELLGVVGSGSTRTEKTPVDTVVAPPETENNVTRKCTTTTYNLETNFEDIAILKPK